MFCPKCGKALSENAKFCGSCGTKIMPRGEQKSAPVEAIAAPIKNKTTAETTKVEMKVERTAETTKKHNGNMTILVEVVIVIILLIVIAAGILVLNKDGKLTDSIKGIIDKKSNVESLLDEEGSETTDDSDLGLEAMLADENYEDVIDKILDLDEDEIADYSDEVNNALEQAVNGHTKLACDEAVQKVEAKEFSEAYEKLDEELEYRNKIAEKLAKINLSSDALDDNTIIEDKRKEISDKHLELVLADAKAADNIEGAQNVFAEADNYFDGDEYEQEKVKVYTNIVLSTLSKMQQNGESASEAKVYIINNLSLIDNNCWALEFWDYFNAVDAMNGGNTVADGQVNHISSDGYIIPDSSTRELSLSDISGFSKIECKLARFEIYARHGRGFSDPSITKFFSNYSWYQEQISYDKFDESELSEIEKANIDVIVQYELQKGYL